MTATKSLSGWMIWGHYACDQCERVAFHYVTEQPDDVRIGMKWLPVTRE